MGVPNWAPRSVTVDGNVYYGHEVNYFFWGFMNAEAKKKGASTSEQRMVTWIIAYRGAVGPAWLLKGTEHDGSLMGRALWAKAGWKYSLTGNFDPPTPARLPLANPSVGEYPGYLGKNTFQITIAQQEVPL